MKRIIEFSQAVIKEADIKYGYIAVVDHDLDRVWLDIDNTEYTIRMWSITEDSVRYSIFRHDDDKAVEIVKSKVYEW